MTTERDERASEDAANERSDAEARVLLDARARKLARPVAAPAEGETGRVELLRFRLGEERYAVEGRFAFGVATRGAVTPVPSVPVFIRGVVNHGGEIVPVVDISVLLGAKTRAELPPLLVIVGEASAEFALGADEVEDVSSYAVGAIESASLVEALRSRAFVWGVLEGRLRRATRRRARARAATLRRRRGRVSRPSSPPRRPVTRGRGAPA